MGSSINAFYVKNEKGLRENQSVASIMLESLIPGSLLFPFRLTFPFRWLHRSFIFNSSCPFDTSFPSFQRFHPVHVLLPFVRSLSCGYVLPFVSTPIQSIRLHACFIATRLFVCYFLPLVSTLPPVTVVTSFLSFQRLPQVVHFVASVLTFHLFYKSNSLLLPFGFTSYSPFVT